MIPPFAHQRAGFTLVEAIVTVGISLFLVTALATTFGSFNSLFGFQNAFGANTRAAGSVLHATRAALLPAHRVVASRAFASGTHSSGASSIVLEVPSVDAGGAVITGRYDYIAFYTASSTAYRLIETDAASARPGGMKRLGGNIASLAFTYNSADAAAATVVTVEVVASTTVKGRAAASRLRESVRLRNF